MSEFRVNVEIWVEELGCNKEKARRRVREMLMNNSQVADFAILDIKEEEAEDEM